MNETGQPAVRGRVKGQLTDREKAFCQEYLLTLNATAAARKAGYAESSCGVRGSKMLKKDKIRAYLDKVRADAESATTLKLKEAKEILTELARGKITDFLDECGEIRIHQVQNARAVREIEVSEWRGSEDEQKRTTKFKLHNPVDAIARLAALNGWDKPAKWEGTLVQDNRLTLGDIRPHVKPATTPKDGDGA